MIHHRVYQFRPTHSTAYSWNTHNRHWAPEEDSDIYGSSHSVHKCSWTIINSSQKKQYKNREWISYLNRRHFFYSYLSTPTAFSQLSPGLVSLLYFFLSNASSSSSSSYWNGPNNLSHSFHLSTAFSSSGQSPTKAPANGHCGRQ